MAKHRDEMSTAAIASFILGMTSLCLGVFAGLPALIAAAVSLTNISRSGNRIRGGGLAISGIVLGCVGMAIQGVLLLKFVFPKVEAVQNEAEVAGHVEETWNNLQTIGYALHQYHDAHRQFPPGGTSDANGRALHSWQTMLLPYMDRGALYGSINLSAPWYDPSNTKIFRTQIVPYLMLDNPERTDAAGYALSHFAGNSVCFRKNKGLSLRDIRDGTSYTILAGEVSSDFKPWGDPSNVRDPAKGLSGGPDAFGTKSGDSVVFLFADGSVTTIKKDTHTRFPRLMKAYSTPAGGEPTPSYIE